MARDRSGLGYSRGQRRLETCAVAVVALLAAANAAKAVPTMVHRHDALGTWLAALAGWIAADFLSGFVHWFGDTWGRVEWPIVGNGLIRGFREHHVDPTAIAKHDFVEASGAISVALIPALVAGLFVSRDSLLGGSIVIFLATFSPAMFFTNEIHKWAHRDDVCRPIAWLQRARLILSPAQHSVHHTAPFDRYYCITTGWLNPFLTAIGFFPALERAVTFATRAEPRSYAGEAPGFSADTSPSIPLVK